LTICHDVATGRGQNADIDLAVFVSADRGNLEGLQHPEQLGLQAQLEVADFIDEEGATIGLLEAPHAPVRRAGESAADVAEEFGFDQRGGDGGAVDGDERPALAAAVV